MAPESWHFPIQRSRLLAKTLMLASQGELLRNGRGVDAVLALSVALSM